MDSDDRILGIIKAEQLIQGVQEEVTEDLQRMFGAGGDERTFSPVTYSLKKRLPWLHVNLATAFLAAAVVALFEDIIAKITVLAVFLPVVAGQGGNAGAQSLAIVMRGLVMREIPKHKSQATRAQGRLAGHDFRHGHRRGDGAGRLGLARQSLARPGHRPGDDREPVGGGLVGRCRFPMVMKAVGLDPAQCSSIILTTVTDVVGFFAFLGFAVFFQSHLV